MRLRLVSCQPSSLGFKSRLRPGKGFSMPAVQFPLPPGDRPDRRIKLQIHCLFPRLQSRGLYNEEDYLPAIASPDDLKTAQQDLLQAKDLDELKTAFKKWRRIGWENVCKLWLQERTPEQLKRENP